MLETEFDEFLRSNTYKVLQRMIDLEIEYKTLQVAQTLIENSMPAEKMKELADNTAGLVVALNSIGDKDVFKQIMKEYELLELEDDTEE